MGKFFPILLTLCLAAGFAPAADTAAEVAADTAAPIQTYSDFYNLLLQKNYEDAYKLLSSPTRQAFERMSKILKQIGDKIKALPEDNPEKPIAQKVLDTLASTDGVSLFAQIMKISLPEGGTLPSYEPPAEMKVTGTLASGHTKKGFPITLYKESGKWMVDLNSGALNTQCGVLEDYLKGLDKKK
jgi:hypothetical protein